MRLYVGHLAYSTTEEQLAEHFAAFQPQSVRIIIDRETGQSRGFGFVEIADSVMANRAISQLHGAELGGRALQVNEARNREDTSPVRRGPAGTNRTRRW